jgi:hypothetical protein
MTIYETILSTYPELSDGDLYAHGIILQDDSDGAGAYIKDWNFSKPIPAGLKIGK